MRTTTRLAALAAGLLLTLAAPGATALQAGPARASAPAVTLTSSSHAPAPAISSSLDGCDSGDFCIYSLNYFEGAKYSWSGNDADWHDNYYCCGYGSVNNQDYSWVNNGTACAGCDHVRVFQYTNYSGSVTICLKRGQAVGAANPADGRGSSHSWYGSCP